MSADELRQAAETLRERAEKATTGPWHGKGDQIRATAEDALVEDSILVAYATGHDHRLGFKKTGAAPDVDYAATMHPGVGLLVAGWLDDAADWEGATGTVNHDMRAHEIARLINSGAS